MFTILLSLLACEPPPFNDTGVDCDAMAALSVAVFLDDEGGAPITGAALTYDAGDGEEDCYEMDPGEYHCGYEVGGDITIYASADGYADGTESIFVDSDECHVIGETLEMTLSSL